MEMRYGHRHGTMSTAANCEAYMWQDNYAK